MNNTPKMNLYDQLNGRGFQKTAAAKVNDVMSKIASDELKMLAEELEVAGSNGPTIEEESAKNVEQIVNETTSEVLLEVSEEAKAEAKKEIKEEVKGMITGQVVSQVAAELGIGGEQPAVDPAAQVDPATQAPVEKEQEEQSTQPVDAALYPKTAALIYMSKIAAIEEDRLIKEANEQQYNVYLDEIAKIANAKFEDNVAQITKIAEEEEVAQILAFEKIGYNIAEDILKNAGVTIESYVGNLIDNAAVASEIIKVASEIADATGVSTFQALDDILASLE